jgi:hypothetical protein
MKVALIGGFFISNRAAPGKLRFPTVNAIPHLLATEPPEFSLED